jgi:hypothetical protein
MIDVVIGFDKEEQVYKVYEPSTDTLLVTTSLGESFIKLSEFLKSKGMIPGELLGDDNVRYHIDSATLLAMVESNANLLKRLNQAPSGFMISGQRFGQSTTTSSSSGNRGGGQKKQKFGGTGGTFSKSKFNESYKKFGDKR